MRGKVCLHASTIVIGDTAVAFSARRVRANPRQRPRLHSGGFPVLATMSTVPLEDAGGFRVPLAYPQLRLWPASVALLYGDANA